MEAWDDFPGGPVVKNSSANAEDAGLIPGLRTKSPHATGQLSQCATTTEPTWPATRSPHNEKPVHYNEKARAQQ